jgi:hypothetical protein
LSQRLPSHSAPAAPTPTAPAGQETHNALAGCAARDALRA